MKWFYVVLSAVMLLFSCSTDIDLNANYKDITIVYGLLNKDADYQYIKIGKAFLGEIAASEMAQVSDSFTYKKADVSVIKLKNGNYIKTIQFNYTDTIKKDSGIFANDKNTIYVSDEKIIENSEINNINDYSYKLEVKIPGKEPVTSEIILVDNVSEILQKDTLAAVSEVNLYKSLGYNSGIYYLYNLRFINPDNAYTTEVCAQCFFYNKIGNDYYLDSTTIFFNGNAKTYSSEYNQELVFRIKGKDFYTKLHENLINKEHYKRVFYCLRFGFLSAGRGLADYIEQTKLSQTGLEDFNAFSNINNGYGVFSSTSFSFSDYMFIDYDSGSLNHLSEKNSPTYVDNFVREGKVLEFFDDDKYDIFNLY